MDDIIRRLDEEYDKVHGHAEGESSDGWSTLELDRGSDDERRSNDSRVKAWVHDGPNWRPKEPSATTLDKDPQGEDAVQPKEELTAQAFVAPACEYLPQRSLTEGERTDLQRTTEKMRRMREQKEFHDEVNGPEATTPELDEYCRMCSEGRNGVLDPHECGYCGKPFLDRKEPQEDEDEEPVDRRTALHLDLHPLTIDPVSMKPEAMPLNAAWRDETDPE